MKNRFHFLPFNFNLRRYIQDQQSKELSQSNVERRAKKLKLAEQELKLPPIRGGAWRMLLATSSSSSSSSSPSSNAFRTLVS